VRRGTGTAPTRARVEGSLNFEELFGRDERLVALARKIQAAGGDPLAGGNEVLERVCEWD
jgi:hypothetical protein